MNIVGLLFIIIYFVKIIVEKKRLEKSRSKIKIIIHVNGIRGKSTVSRLIDAGLRDGKTKVFTKVTGTNPRYINVEGIEKPINRRGKANIREQIKIINKGAKSRAEILVLECMAVKPEFQRICEDKILRANISVITNVREDHLDEMGDTLEKIAESLSSTICTNGALFTGDKNYFEFFKEVAKKKNTKAYLSSCENKEYEEIDFPENVALALEVCTYCGVDKKEALERMKNYKRDVGILKGIQFKNKLEKNIYFLNAMAANDPNSTENIIKLYKEKPVWKRERYLMVNNRKDRLTRLKQFAKFVKENQGDYEKIFISGESKNIFYKNLKHLKDKIRIIEDLNEFDELSSDSLIIAVGNICGKGKEILEKIERRGEK
ncbi:poly-gamma-glutamate synthase PgsB [Fusobacterium sp. IOR10]|uniref:poly-gamma-glutamate synthase PgsB n=1 Tax=Fusobacterium sp. IOR10 TaxID=2665157 RepID=UPI0013D10D8E|nr:poly-gamma-glutamate synthase PgsB [Fusobacterium sp. IOR10]